MKQFVNSSSHNFSTANQNGKSFAEDTSKFWFTALFSSSHFLETQSLLRQLYGANTCEQHAVNILVANMAASDLLISIFAVPIKLWRDRGWPSKVVAGRNCGLDFVHVFLFPTGHFNCSFNSESGSHCH